MSTAADHDRFWSPPSPDLATAADLGVLAPSLAAREALLGRHLRRGVWLRYGQVVVRHNGPLTGEQELWTAVLRAPRDTVTDGATVLSRSTMRWPAPPLIQLLSPAAGPTADIPGVRGRRSRVLGPLDIHPSAQPPQARLARAVVDHMVTLSRPDDVRALLCAPVQQRLLRAEDLRATVERLGRVRHRALALTTLVDVGAGAHSLHELDYTRLMRRARLPEPDRQTFRTGPGGRRFLDAAYDKWRLHVELDGLGHLQISTWSDDCDRTNELELGKDVERRLRFPGFWLTERPEHVVDQVRRGLRRGGWPG